MAIMINENRMNSLMGQAVAQSRHSIRKDGGGPFGAVIATKGGRVIAADHNWVVKHSDPTAHAEISAIRKVGQLYGLDNLNGSVLITSCEPCPQCLNAAHQAGIDEIFYANTRREAAEIAGFDDEKFYREMAAFGEGRYGEIEILVSRQKWNLTAYQNNGINLEPQVTAIVTTSNGVVLAAGKPEVIKRKDPTAHGGVRAIQNACRKIENFQLTGLTLAMSCSCIGCIGGAMWARPAQLIVGYGDESIKRDSALLHEQVALSMNPSNHPKMAIPMIRIDYPGALTVFEEWRGKINKTPY